MEIPRRQPSPAKHWCITLNNPVDGDEERFNNPLMFEYAIFGREVGKEGTPHLQAYICLHKKKVFSTVKKLFPRAHIEPKSKLSTPAQAADYCKKDMDFVEYGILPLPQWAAGAERSKEIWEETKELLRQGQIESVDPEIYIKHYNTLVKIQKKFRPIPPDLTEQEVTKKPNQWIYGPTGTGKSRRARSENPGFYFKQLNEWWENYNDEEVVLIEDIDKYHIKLGGHLKIWADRYGFRGSEKFSSVVLRPKKIIVTSNYSIREIWPDPSTYEPLERRFKQIYMPKTVNPFEIMMNREDSGEEADEDERCLICCISPCLCEII